MNHPSLRTLKLDTLASALTRASTLALAAFLLLSTARLAAAPVEEGQYYRIKNVRSQKMLALGDDAATAPGAQIIQRQPGKDARQQWKFVKQGRFYMIVNRQNGQALNVQSNSMDEGAPIIQWDASVKAQNQQWSIEKHAEGYAIKARHSGMVLDVASGTTERKAPLIQYKFANSTNQLFELEPVN